jgi:hypothetical protein
MPRIATVFNSSSIAAGTGLARHMHVKRIGDNQNHTVGVSGIACWWRVGVDSAPNTPTGVPNAGQAPLAGEHGTRPRCILLGMHGG